MFLCNIHLFIGVYNLDAGVGVYAPDYESYKVFSALFDPIIQEYHGFGPNDKQPDVDLGEGRTKDLEPLDREGKYKKVIDIFNMQILADFGLWDVVSSIIMIRLSLFG